MQTFDFVSSYSYFEANFPVFKKCRGIYIAKILGYNLEFSISKNCLKIVVFNKIGKKVHKGFLVSNKRIRFIPKNLEIKTIFEAFKNLN